MTVYQFLHTLSYGDAISDEALAINEILDKKGFKSHIVCLNVHPKYKGKVILLKDFLSDYINNIVEEDIVILHYSIGCVLNEIFTQLQCTKGLIFHNLTPVKWFLGVNPRIVRELEQGWKELVQICKEADLVISDSDFNRRVLEDLGISSRVLPLCFNPSRWQVPANKGIRKILRGSGEINLLSVGRIAPNKRLEDILKVFYFFHHHIFPKSRLWLVGIDVDTEIYSFYLKRLAQELSLDRAVEFTGRMDDSEVKALYENSDLYVCMSEHEGFCLPIVEAMRFSLPVVAYSSTAVEETVGEGGVLFDNKDYPRIAELMGEIIRNGSLRNKIIIAGRKRADHFGYSNFVSNFEKILEQLCNAKVSNLSTACDEGA